MTAEIIIGNGFGVVVAADEATTTSRGDREIRTYDGAEIISGLPAPHALAVLHCGNVNLHGVPYSTFVDTWIKTLPEKALNTVADYVHSFEAFLLDQIPKYSQEDVLLREHLDQFRSICGEIQEHLSSSKKLNPRGIREYFTELTKSQDELSDRENSFIDGLMKKLGKDERLNVLEEECRNVGCPHLDHSSIEGILNLYFDENSDEEGIILIQKWARGYLASSYPANDSGDLTFVGYGEKDVLPVLDSHAYYGFVNGKLFSNCDSYKPARKHGSGYCLFEMFGQSSEIKRFINESGLSVNFIQSEIRSSVSKFARVHDSDVETNDFDEEIQTLNPGARIFELGNQIESDISERVSEQFSHALASFAGKNLTTLVSIAARLVRLQNLSLELRNKLPTVGPKVTVATITKAKGFTFIKPESIDSL